jgi:hypothetical protein
MPGYFLIESGHCLNLKSGCLEKVKFMSNVFEKLPIFAAGVIRWVPSEGVR